jgi:uncharacterized protein (TIGR02246 family)
MQQAMPSCQGKGPSAVAGPAPVLTVAVQAAGMRGGRQTERQLLPFAVGQGVLSPRLEAELASSQPGVVRRWRVGPRERPRFLAGHPWLPCNGLIWLELEVLESPQPSLPDTGPSGCALISQGEVQMLFERWNRALQSQDPEQVARLYSRDAVLLPTLSDEPRNDHASIVDYFSHFLEKRPHGEISQWEILIGCNMLQDAGLYTFRFADGSSAEARYSFIYIFEDGQWKISHHHSSLLPESAV